MTVKGRQLVFVLPENVKLLSYLFHNFRIENGLRHLKFIFTSYKFKITHKIDPNASDLRHTMT